MRHGVDSIRNLLLGVRIPDHTIPLNSEGMGKWIQPLAYISENNDDIRNIVLKKRNIVL